MEEKAFSPDGLIEVGRRVSTDLYGRGRGTVYAVHGSQSPGSIRRLGGIIHSGGSANFDIVFDDGHRTRALPEGILRGVQWSIRDEVASEAEISQALRYADRHDRLQALNEQHESRIVAEMRKQARRAFPFMTPIADKMAGNSGSYKEARKAARQNYVAFLQAAFPGVKFSVKSDDRENRTVSWEDGPESQAVQVVIDALKSGGFNGMEDMEFSFSGTAAVIPGLFGGSHYSSTKHHRSDAAWGAAVKQSMGEAIFTDATGERLTAIPENATQYEARHRLSHYSMGDRGWSSHWNLSDVTERRLQNENSWVFSQADRLGRYASLLLTHYEMGAGVHLWEEGIERGWRLEPVLDARHPDWTMTAPNGEETVSVDVRDQGSGKYDLVFTHAVHGIAEKIVTETVDAKNADGRDIRSALGALSHHVKDALHRHPILETEERRAMRLETEVMDLTKDRRQSLSNIVHEYLAPTLEELDLGASEESRRNLFGELHSMQKSYTRTFGEFVKLAQALEIHDPLKVLEDRFANYPEDRLSIERDLAKIWPAFSMGEPPALENGLRSTLLERIQQQVSSPLDQDVLRQTDEALVRLDESFKEPPSSGIPSIGDRVLYTPAENAADRGYVAQPVVGIVTHIDSTSGGNHRIELSIATPPGDLRYRAYEHMGTFSTATPDTPLGFVRPDPYLENLASHGFSRSGHGAMVRRDGPLEFVVAPSEPGWFDLSAKRQGETSVHVAHIPARLDLPQIVDTLMDHVFYPVSYGATMEQSCAIAQAGGIGKLVTDHKASELGDLAPVLERIAVERTKDIISAFPFNIDRSVSGGNRWLASRGFSVDGKDFRLSFPYVGDAWSMYQASYQVSAIEKNGANKEEAIKIWALRDEVNQPVSRLADEIRAAVDNHMAENQPRKPSRFLLAASRRVAEPAQPESRPAQEPAKPVAQPASEAPPAARRSFRRSDLSM